MTMKNKITLFITIFIGIFFIFYWQITEKQKINQTTIDSALIPVKQALFDLQQSQEFSEMNKNEQLNETIAVLDKIPDSHKHIKHQYQVALSGLPEINFYGRVVDQYGLPVNKAQIWYSGTNAYLSAGGGSGVLYTDEEGFFEISTSGSELVLGAVSHPEIDKILYELPDVGNNARAAISSIILDSHNNGAHKINYTNYSEKENAYIINAWRLGKYEGAIGSNLLAAFDSDGKLYTLSLDRKTFRDQIAQGKKDGQLYISCTRPHMQSLRDYGDWSVSIVPVNGGIQETNDTYMNLAPISGYQSSFDISMKPGDENYSHKLKKYFYFKSNGGKEYGSLIVNMRPFKNSSKEACRIDIGYKINPTGSRNLELKQNNTSQPHLPIEQKNWQKLGAEHAKNGGQVLHFAFIAL